MPLEPKKSRIVLFFVVGFGLALLMAGLKALFAWVAYTYAYSVPWIGGFLKSIEIAEVSNLVVFAMLGAGIGVATILLPAGWSTKIKLAFLLALSPFVFSASYMMMQHLWIQQVASRGNISFREARTITNSYLKRETGKSGFFGFYPFSTQTADMPIQLEVLRAEQSVNPSQLLTQELSNYNDPRADLAVYIFERVGWLIRFMYMTIAVLTAVIYYFKGALWADGRKAEGRRPDGKRAVAGPSAMTAPTVAKSPMWKRNATKGKVTKKKGTKSKAPVSSVSDPKASAPKASNPKMRKPLIGKPSNSSTSRPIPNSAPTPAQNPPPKAPKKSPPNPSQSDPRTLPAND